VIKWMLISGTTGAGLFEKMRKKISRSHNITINYISALPIQKVKVNLDGVEKTFQKEVRVMYSTKATGGS